jgi:hypothetical protein
MLLNGAAQIEEMATQLAEKLEKLNIQATEHASLLMIALPRGFLEISCSLTRFSDSFVS